MKWPKEILKPLHFCTGFDEESKVMGECDSVWAQSNTVGTLSTACPFRFLSAPSIFRDKRFFSSGKPPLTRVLMTASGEKRKIRVHSAPAIRPFPSVCQGAVFWGNVLNSQLRNKKPTEETAHLPPLHAARTCARTRRLLARVCQALAPIAPAVPSLSLTLSPILEGTGYSTYPPLARTVPFFCSSQHQNSPQSLMTGHLCSSPPLLSLKPIPVRLHPWCCALKGLAEVMDIPQVT